MADGVVTISVAQLTASLRVIDAFRRSGRNALRVLGVHGQLGYEGPLRAKTRPPRCKIIGTPSYVKCSQSL
jgi:hypothetical protein